MRRGFGSYLRHYLTYRSFRTVDKAGREAAGCLGGTVKLILWIFVALIVVTSVAVVFPYILIGIVAVGLVVLVVYLVRRRKRCVKPPLGRDLRRDVEIIRECQELVNDSQNLDTVACRYDRLVSVLTEMQARPQSDFDYYGVHFGVPISDTLSLLESKKATIFCQAIDRAFAKCKKHISGLKTEKGKQNALYRFHAEARSVLLQHDIPDACLSYLDDVVGSFR